MLRQGSFLAVLLLGLAMAGCTQTRSFQADEAGGDTPAATSDAPEAAEVAEARGEPVRVLLMPADIALYEITVGGLLEPKADWSNAALWNVTGSIELALAEMGAALTDYAAPPEGTPEHRLHTQLIKLHGVVGNTIFAHTHTQTGKLPTKGDALDWTLGSDVRALRADIPADYALFVFFRDSYASDERKTLMAVGLLAAFLGVPVYAPAGGVQIGFASLIDLETGDIEWFNVVRSTTGDIRTPGPARETVDNLLKDIPL